MIGLESRSSKLIVEKSTVPLQTGGKLLRALTAYGRKTGHKYHVASNPEFLRQAQPFGISCILTASSSE